MADQKEHIYGGDVRRTSIAELQRVTGPFAMNEHKIGPGDRISIASLADGTPGYLDGNVYSSTVNLVPSRQMPYSGTRWQLQLNQGGTWSFLNQGQAEQMLSGSGNIITLGRVPEGSDVDRFSTTLWLIYRDLTGFRLRPAMQKSGWLGVRDGKAVLCGVDEPVGRWIYWAIAPFRADE